MIDSQPIWSQYFQHTPAAAERLMTLIREGCQVYGKMTPEQAASKHLKLHFLELASGYGVCARDLSWGFVVAVVQDPDNPTAFTLKRPRALPPEVLEQVRVSLPVKTKTVKRRR